MKGKKTGKGEERTCFPANQRSGHVDLNWPHGRGARCRSEVGFESKEGPKEVVRGTCHIENNENERKKHWYKEEAT